MEKKEKGVITKVLDVQNGTSKDGKEWKKQSFIIDTKEEYNNILCFDIFGVDKVDNFQKYNKVGDNVIVTYNIVTNEWKEKYYTSLGAWKIEKDTNAVTEVKEQPEPIKDSQDTDFPF